MRLHLSEIFADAGAMWRGGPELLVAISGVFFLLPALASMLFLPVANLEGLEGEAFSAAVFAYLWAQSPWLIARFVVESMGVGVMLLMLLDPARPSVGGALAHALRLLPGLIIARFIAAMAVTLGWIMLFVPGLWLMGRTFITSALYVSEGRGPAGAAVAAFERTRGNGWLLLLVIFIPWGSSVFLAGTVLQIATAAEAMGPVLSAPLMALAAVITAGSTLLAVLLEAAAYRALPPPSTGT